jgi:hypothetical protein
LTSPILRERGLAQGSILSPLLFNIFIDPLAQALQPNKSSLSFPLSALLLADDIALFGTSQSCVQSLLDVVLQWSNCNGLKLNPSKCGSFGIPPSNPLKMGDSTVPCLSAYKYLGVHFDPGGIDFPTFCKSLVKKASKIFYPVISRSIACDWENRWRLDMYKSFIRSRMEYCGGILYVWLVANSFTPASSHLPKYISNLFDLNDRAVSWICGLKPTAKPRGSGGIYVLQSISGILPFFLRLAELAVLFKTHIISAHPDNPVHLFCGSAAPPPPWHTKTLAPRLAALQEWHQWLK